MRALLQRVSEAEVSVDGAVVGRCGAGLLVLVCAMQGDTGAEADRLAAPMVRRLKESGRAHDLKSMGAVREAVAILQSSGVAVAAPAMDMEEADWLKTIDVNLNGCWRVATEAGRRLRKADKPGSVINITSILGHRVAAALAPYAASKSALEQLTRSLALEWARHGIRVMTIAPGVFETPMMAGIPDDALAALSAAVPFPKRLGRATEFAMLAEQIVTNAMLNGETIRLDGGIRMQ